ncbi:MFS transporter [Brevibacterium yomogidense]|uniref:MFS transporter n=1 Tax=Brevibacterium yomogidense TaxID=946573 RepID=UPI0018DFD713
MDEHAARAQAGTPRPPLGPRYLRLLGSAAAANLGDGLMAVAVVWLATSLTRDPVLITVVALASRLPWLLFTLHAGVLADRYDRVRLVAWMDAVRAALVTVLTAAVVLVQDDLPDPAQIAAGAAPAAGSGWVLAALCTAAFLLGLAEVVRDNAAQTMLPTIVPHARLETANGRLWGVETVTNSFLGPPVAGALIGVAAAVPFGVNAGLLAIAAVLVASIARTTTPSRTSPRNVACGPNGQSAHTPQTAHGAQAGHAAHAHSASWSADIVEGFRWLWSHRVLRDLALTLGAMNMLGALTSAVFVLFVQDVLGLFAGWQFGLMLTGMAVGAVIASLVGDRVTERLRPGTALSLSVSGMVVATLVIALSSHAAVVWTAGAVEGFFVVVWNIVTVSFRQRIIPDHLLGRVNSVYRLFGWGTIAVGSLTGGLVVAAMEPFVGREWALRSVFLLTATGMLCALLIVVRRLSNHAIDSALAAQPARTDQSTRDGQPARDGQPVRDDRPSRDDQS